MDNENRKMMISGKHNVYKMKQAVNGGNKPEPNIREKMKDLKEEDLNQVELINKIYMDMDNNDVIKEYDTIYTTLIKQELETKRNGYKQQDIKKGLYDVNLLITRAEIVEKLVGSKLKCAYCSVKVLLLYKNVREPTQWTLDRKYNDDCHSNENTLIACLKCNLERRVKNVDKFTFTKKLRIKKEM